MVILIPNFFHVAASSRREVNKIRKLQDNAGVLHEDPDKMCEIAFDYFMELFNYSHDPDYEAVLQAVPSRVTGSDNSLLLKPFTIEEFRRALFKMHPDKSLGPDGLNPVFYQCYWSLSGPAIFDECISWISRGNFPTSLNDSNIVLIPKCDNPVSM